MVLTILACLVQEKIIKKFLLASLKTLTTSKNCSKNRNKFLFWLYFALIGKFFLAYIHSRLYEQFSGAQAAFGTTFRNTGSYQKAGTKESYWKDFHNYSFDLQKSQRL
jgi:hypothetical protein